MIKFTPHSLAEGLRFFVGAESPSDLVLHLFSDVGSTPGTFTELSGFGYAPRQIPGSAWSIRASDCVAECAPQAFVFTGELGLVRGYYLTRLRGGDLVGYERFAQGPIRVENNGDSITIIPTISFE